jgi:hypothetical protein
MAHPTQAFPKGFYLLDEAQAATGEFYAIQCLAAGTITIKGTGIFEYSSGFSETGATTDITITLPAGATIYGNFSSVNVGSTAQCIAYYK